jgi:glycosyltransferase involved in cell wall biosynthesis
MTPLSWFSLAVLVASLGVYGAVFRGWHKLGQLRDVKPELPSPPPAVSIVVAARNEAGAIEAAVRSILAIDYPALEVVVVDDRSTDATGAILDRLAAEFPGLRVEHVRDLPAGWLGKNHALHRGAQRAHGDYLVFADADVIFEASAIRRAISYCEATRLDHLTVIPDVPTRSLFVELGMMGGFVGLLAMYRPWRARSSGRHDLGVGAFNLVRAAPFRALGGHETLAMEVLDDIELGGLMGKSNLRQDMLLGHGMISVEMYGTAPEMFRGIQKNVFTFLEYSVWKLLAATAITFAFSVWPWAGILVTEGATRWINVAAAAVPVALYLHLAPQFRYNRVCVLYLPIMGFVTIFLFWQIAITTWIRRGVTWRGTFYSLAELKSRRAMRGR